VTLNSLLVICGLALFAFYAHRSALAAPAFQAEIAAHADRVMPQFIVQELPPGISGLLLAALLAAAMSSLSSGINSISGVFVGDFLERFGWIQPESGLRANKVVSVFAGLFGIAFSLLIVWTVRQTNWNLVELTQRVNHLFVGPIAVLFFAGILFRKAGMRSAVLGFALGVFTSVFIAFGKEWFGLVESISFTWLVPFSFLAGFLASAVLSLVFAPPQSEKVEAFTLNGLR